jgi:simple sugar transport system permease protein
VRRIIAALPAAGARALAGRLAMAGLLACLVAAVLVAADGHSPLAALVAFLHGAFGSRRAIAAGLDRSTPYLLAGVGVALCFRAGVINIGAEGQIAVGGLAATAAALSCPTTNALVAIPFALAAGALAGALWAGIAAALHLTRSVHEVLATLLTNFVALLLVQLVLAGPLGEIGAGFLQSPPIPRFARLPQLPVLDAHAGLLIAFVASAFGSWLLWRTRLGFALRLLGQSRSAVTYAGYQPPVLIAAVMLLAGALAGLAGAVELLGLHRRLVEGFSADFGFRGVTVALLAFLEPLAAIPAALLVGFLETGAQAMQREIGVPSSLVTVLEATTVLSVLAATARRVRA